MQHGSLHGENTANAASAGSGGSGGGGGGGGGESAVIVRGSGGADNGNAGALRGIVGCIAVAPAALRL